MGYKFSRKKFKSHLSKQVQKGIFPRKFHKSPNQKYLRLILVTMLNLQEDLKDNPAIIDLFKVNNKKNRKRCEIC